MKKVVLSFDVGVLRSPRSCVCVFLSFADDSFLSHSTTSVCRNPSDRIVLRHISSHRIRISSHHTGKLDQHETKADPEGRAQQRPHQEGDRQQPVPPGRHEPDDHRKTRQRHAPVGEGPVQKSDHRGKGQEDQPHQPARQRLVGLAHDRDAVRHERDDLYPFPFQAHARPAAPPDQGRDRVAGANENGHVQDDQHPKDEKTLVEWPAKGGHQVFAGRRKGDVLQKPCRHEEDRFRNGGDRPREAAEGLLADPPRGFGGGARDPPQVGLPGFGGGGAQEGDGL
mmetsp:Transcript_20729/g.43374  ORF Transcript_20729/g.43374 Transcript_20729/m.43374 type:complete len:282 (+) Transcript_20729:43-888(+)